MHEHDGLSAVRLPRSSIGKIPGTATHNFGCQRFYCARAYIVPLARSVGFISRKRIALFSAEFGGVREFCSHICELFTRSSRFSMWPRIGYEVLTRNPNLRIIKQLLVILTSWRKNIKPENNNGSKHSPSVFKTKSFKLHSCRFSLASKYFHIYAATRKDY